VKSIGARSCLTVLLLITGTCAPATSFEPASLEARENDECFVFAGLHEDTPIVSNPAECGVKTAPASTFKIPHALIALQTGVITTKTMFKWDGTPHTFESWRKDHTLESAIKSSVLPFFHRTAALIGRDRMRQGLSSLAYAADTFDGQLSTFWIDGDLVVSPLEQFAFLQRMFSGSLPIEASHLSAVKDALRMPPGQIVLGAGARPFLLDWPAVTVVHAKTGNTTVKGERISWLVGALELKRVNYVFVGRARSRKALDSTAGADVARRGLDRVVPK
jgi:beta-lactamase class D